MSSFKIAGLCPKTMARAGELITPHGVVPTPVFIPVGSQGIIKTLTPEELKALGATIILGNSYHLYLRPGVGVIERLGGLHRFMAWDKPILTDSGGYQIFSLAPLRSVSDEGVRFRSHIDGSEHFLTPELAIELQEKLGSDIIMAFDECPSYEDRIDHIREAMERTHHWAERCLMSQKREDQILFGIVQGGTSVQLRRQSADLLTSLGFPGYAIGGLSLGETKSVMHAIIEETVASLPENKPRYLMGVGSPEDLFEGVSRGIDIFDSALPTRVARNGALFTRQGRHNIENTCFREWDGPIDTECDCYTCRNFSAAYLHHLFKCQDLLSYRLATIHNLRFIIRLMEEIRQSITEGTFPAAKEGFLASYQATDEETRLSQKKKWLESKHRG